MRPAPTVFLSSTYEDLQPYRAAAIAAAVAEGFAVQAQEYMEASANSPYAECMDRVDRAHVVVALSAYRYGWEPKDQPAATDPTQRKSITWLECEQAAAKGKDVLPFLVDEHADWPLDLREEYRLMEAAQSNTAALMVKDIQRRVNRLKEFKGWLIKDRIRATFRNPDDLRAQVGQALRAWRDKHPEFAHTAPPPRIPPDPTPYLEYLRNDTGFIAIRGLVVSQLKAPVCPIEDIYVPLADELSRPDEGATQKGMLADLLDRHPRLVILGDPGSGKTTFLRRIANSACAARLADDTQPFPILLRVTDLANAAAPADLAPLIAAQCKKLTLPMDAEFIQERLTQGPALLLIDGLDEAPNDQTRQDISDLIEHAAAAWPRCRIVVTTRPQAYEGEVMLGAGFYQARIAPLEPEAVRTFLTHWSSALFRDNPPRAALHGRELIEAVESRPQIRRIASNPVMLTALAVLHWNERKMPQQRAELYESILGWLAKSREERPGRVAPDVCIARLEQLAGAMQGHPKGRQVQVDREWAKQVLAVAPPIAETFLKEEEADSGIIVNRGSEVRFQHLTFQEYLAARMLAGFTDADRHRLLFNEGRAWRADWREVVELLAGRLHATGAPKVDALIAAMLDDLYGADSLARRAFHWMGFEPPLIAQARAASLIGAILRDLEPLHYTPSDERYRKVLDAVLGVFDAEKSRGIPLKQRLEAAEALGQAGDPRLHYPNNPEYWITVDNRFQIGRFPATVYEYKRYVEEGGGEKPWEWDDQLGHPNRPVTRVSWNQASAYCRWAGVRLLKEAEWERAAHGAEGRAYPWGNEPPDAGRANYKETKLGHPTPVGLFPRGATPEGIQDLAGNVWAWVEDWFDSDQKWKVLRGGAFYAEGEHLQSGSRDWDRPDVRGLRGGGFRCARDLNSL